MNITSRTHLALCGKKILYFEEKKRRKDFVKSQLRGKIFAHITGVNMATVAVNWKSLSQVQLSPHWYELQRVRKIVSHSFAGLAVLSFGATLVVGGNVTRGFAGAVTLLFFSYVIGGRIPPSLNDPSVALKEKEKAGETWTKQLTFKALYQHHRPLLEKGIIGAGEIDTLLGGDIRALDYDGFMKKHSPEGDESFILNRISRENRDVLRMKYLAAADDREQPVIRLLLKISDEEWRLARINRGARLATNWETFVKKFGDIAAVQTTDLDGEVNLRNLFLAHTLKGLKPGPLSIPFRAEAKHFIDVERTIFLLKQACSDRSKSSEIVEWYQGDYWAGFLEKLDPARLPEVKKMLRQVYLHTHHYDLWHEPRMKPLRDLLEMTEEIIEQFVRLECELLDYLGRDGFRARHGERPLVVGVLHDVHQEKIRAEIREVGLTTRDLGKLYRDVKALGMVKELFEQHYRDRTLQSIWKNNEHEVFLRAFKDGLLSASEWKEKAIQETEHLPIFEIVLDFPGLIGVILEATDRRLNGRTFAEDAEYSLRFVKHLNQTIDRTWNFSSMQTAFPLFVDLKLIDQKNPDLRRLLQAFILQHREEILQRGKVDTLYCSAYQGWQYIIRMPYWTDLTGTYQRASEIVEKAHEQQTTKLRQIQEEYERMSTEAKQREDTARKDFEEKKKKRLEDVEASLKTVGEELAKLHDLPQKEPRKLAALESKYERLSQSKQLIRAEWFSSPIRSDESSKENQARIDAVRKEYEDVLLQQAQEIAKVFY